MTGVAFVVLTSGTAHGEDSALARALRVQSDGRWRTVAGSADQRFDEGWTEQIRDAVAVAVVTPDLDLDPTCVERVLAAFEHDPGLDALYGDAAAADPTGAPVLRPAWSPDLLRRCPYVGDPLFVRPDLLSGVAQQGGPDRIRAGVASALIERHATVGHLIWPLARLGPDDRDAAAVARPAPPLEPLDDRPPVAVIVPSAGVRDDGEPMVRRCLRSLGALSWPDLDVVVVVGDEYEGDPGELEADFASVRVVTRPPGPFSFATAVNTGLLASRAPFVLLLNDDVEAPPQPWLDALVGHALDPGVGAVGARLRYPDGTLQHAGMVIDDAYPLHPFQGRPLAEDTRIGGPDVARNVVAVTGACLLARRRHLLAVGGLSSELPASFNDVDLCLKLGRRGWRTVYEPAATLVHHEGRSRGRTTAAWEWDRFVARWGEVDDPWYHPGYTRPDDPADRRRNADHLLPVGAVRDGTVRRAELHSRVHHSRMG